MAKKSNSFERFWQELKRRKVVHVITVYVAIAFGILQLVDIIGPSLKWADWTMTFVIVLLCIGFIISVFVSWIYDITPAGVKKTKPVSAVKHTDHTTTPTSSGWKITTYISAVIIVALIAFNFISRRNLNTDISKLEKSIAVLPFINDSPSDSTTYFINGVMEEVLTNLQKIKEFRVLSRTSTDQYKGQDRPTIPEIAKKQGVSYIVEGSGQKYGNTLILRVQLIKGKGKEAHLWAKTYEQEIKEVKDYIRIPSQIAQSISAELKAVITPEEKHIIEKATTTSLTAHDFYLRGKEEQRRYLQYNTSSRIYLDQAEQKYRKALEFDPTFAYAYTGLASVYWEKHYWDNYYSENFLDSILILCDIALNYDNLVAEAYLLKGNFYYNSGGMLDKALREYDKALRINPNYWEAYLGKGQVLVDEDNIESLKNFQHAALINRGPELPVILRSISELYFRTGFREKADYYANEAFRLDGDSINYFGALWSYEFWTGNFNKCIEILNKIFLPNTKIKSIMLANPGGLFFIGYTYSMLGQFEESLDYFKKYIESLKTQPQGYIGPGSEHRIGYTFWQSGDRKEAEYFFNKHIENMKTTIKLGRLHSQNLRSYYDLAGVYAFKGESDKAYENLKIFNKDGKMSLYEVTLIKTDPLFNSLRNESEFQQIVKDVETKYQAEHERVRKWLEEQGML
jgi:TolB-like protein